MTLLEVLTLAVLLALLAGIVPGVQARLRGRLAPEQPSRLLARLIQPDPFPATVSSPIQLAVMVLTVANNSFTPEAGAEVFFAVSRGNASLNGSPAMMQTTDRMGVATVQLTPIRSGHDELSVSVISRGISMVVSPPIAFETMG